MPRLAAAPAVADGHVAWVEIFEEHDLEVALARFVALVSTEALEGT